jgi:hypothetical protein
VNYVQVEFGEAIRMCVFYPASVMKKGDKKQYEHMSEVVKITPYSG